MISGQTALYGLVAHPARHSLSPKIQNQWFSEKQIDARYVAFDTQANAREVVQAIQTLGIAGVNLSMPYKQALLPLITELSSTAQLIGAINTVKNQNGHLSATSTDGAGFWQAFKRANPNQPVQQLVVLGAGGAALAVIEAAGRAGVQQVTVFKRQNATFAQVQAQLQAIGRYHDLTIEVVPYEATALMATALKTADCVVNATNIGMALTPGLPIESSLIDQIKQEAVVVDLIYAPQATAFLKKCRQRQLVCQNGLGMLIEQAALSFQFWTNQTIDTTNMYQQLMEEF